MPLDYTSRNIVAGGASPYIPLITNNPAFQVEIVPLDGRLEQKPNQTKDARLGKIAVGDSVRGEEISKSRKSGKQHIARVISIEQNNGQITAYKAITQRGAEVLLDPTTVTKMDIHGEDPNPMTAPQTQLEAYTPANRVMLYEQWIVSRES